MKKNLLPLNEEYIFENVYLVVVKINKGTMKVLNMKFSRNTIYTAPNLVGW